MPAALAKQTGKKKGGFWVQEKQEMRRKKQEFFSIPLQKVEFNI